MSQLHLRVPSTHFPGNCVMPCLKIVRYKEQIFANTHKHLLANGRKFSLLPFSRVVVLVVVVVTFTRLLVLCLYFYHLLFVDNFCNGVGFAKHIHIPLQSLAVTVVRTFPYSPYSCTHSAR